MEYESLNAFLENLPRMAEPSRDKLRGHDNLFQLNVQGGQQVYIRIEDGLVSVQEEAQDYPACIVTADEKLLLDLISGRVSPMKALLFGKVNIRGDVKPLLTLCSLF